jgi:hypothetical protein
VKRFIPLSYEELSELGLDDDECLAAAMLLVQRVDSRLPLARCEERLSACLIAFLYQFGHVEKAAHLLEAIGNWPRMLRLVADELDYKRGNKTDLTLTGERIVYVYWAVRLLENGGVVPMVAEVEAYWPNLFGKTRAPTARSIRQTLKLKDHPLRSDPHRGPRGPWKSRRKTGRNN